MKHRLKAQDSLTYSPESSGLEPVGAGILADSRFQDPLARTGSPPELGAKEQGSLGPQLLAPEAGG